jgi:hypothetical protein
VYRIKDTYVLLTGLLHLPETQQNSLVQYLAADGTLKQTVILPGTYTTSAYYNKIYQGYDPKDMIVSAVRTDTSSLGLISFEANVQYTSRGFNSYH